MSEERDVLSSWERLIMSDVFSIHMAMEYLHSKCEEDIQHLVCKKLVLYPSSDLEFYLPQLICLCLASPELYPWLQSFILDTCSKFSHFALLASWTLKAELDAEKDFEKQKTVAELLHKVNMASMDLDGGKLHKNVGEQSSPITYATVVATSTTSPSQPQSPLHPPISHPIHKHLSLEKEKEFIRQLVDIGEILRKYKDKDTRRAHLFGELSKINGMLPSRVYLPMSIIPEGESDPMRTTTTFASTSSLQSLQEEKKNQSEMLSLCECNSLADGIADSRSNDCSLDSNEINEKSSVSHSIDDCESGSCNDMASSKSSKTICPKCKGIFNDKKQKSTEYQILGPHHIVRVPPEEAVVLNSKDKAPYMLQVEVVECNDFYLSPLPRKQRIRRQNLHGHSRSRSDGSHIPMISYDMFARTTSDIDVSSDDKDSGVMFQNSYDEREVKSEHGGVPLNYDHSRTRSTSSSMHEFTMEEDDEHPHVAPSKLMPTVTSPQIVYTPTTQPNTRIFSHHRNPSTEGVTYTVGSGRQSRNKISSSSESGEENKNDVSEEEHSNNNSIASDGSDGVLMKHVEDGEEDDLSDTLSMNDEEEEDAIFEANEADVSNEPSMTVNDIRKRLHYASSTPESKFRLSQSDPSAIKAKENWGAKVSRIRSLSPYGHLPTWRLVPVIVKSGDDLRQEVLASQLLALFQWVWKEENVSLWVRPLQVLVTSVNGGMIEVVGSAVSLHQTKKKAGDTLLDYFVQQFGAVDSPSFSKAQDNFVRSLAAYSLFTYFAQVKDRHNGNILIDSQGHLMHIDFGFFLSNSPGGNFGFETAPFKLLKDFVQVMGGSNSDVFSHFKTLLFEGFLAARKHKAVFVTLLSIMAEGTDFPCFAKKRAVQDFEARFCHGQTDLSLRAHVEDLVKKSMGNTRTKLYDNFQYFTNGIL
eukprot:m.68100 g.68100  ORF g.68100 m.68100 type:complete len:923 (+) comp8235_c0_seq1:324-3092(+)